MKHYLFILFQCLILTQKTGNCEPFELLILYSNNVHFLLEDKLNSTTRLFNILNKTREEARLGKGPPVLYLNTVDSFKNSTFGTYSDLNLKAKFMNSLQPDVVYLELKDFRQQIRNLINFAKLLNCSIITDILKFKYIEEIENYLKYSRVVSIGRRTVGIIGYNFRKTRKLKFEIMLNMIRRESLILHGMGVDIIIALGYGNYKMIRKLAEKVNYIDAIVGSYKILSKDRKQFILMNFIWDNKKKHFILQEYAPLSYLSFLNVKFEGNDNAKSYKRYFSVLDEVKSHVQKQPHLSRDITRSKRSKSILGRTKSILSSDCIKDECNFGNLVTDAMCYYGYSNLRGHLENASWWTDYPMAFIKGGIIKKTIEPTDNKGEITEEDLKEVFPNAGWLVAAQLSGYLIENMLMNTLRNAGNGKVELIQMSGVHIWYNDSDVQMFLINVRCGNCFVPGYERLLRERQYKVLMNDQLFQEISAREISIEEKSILAIVIEYIQVQKLLFYGTEDRYLETDLEIISAKRSSVGRIFINSIF